MTDDRKAGIALITGSVGGILTMAIHPSGMASQSAEKIAHVSLISGIAHSVALASILLLFLGACGFTRRIAATDRISFAAIVIYGFACVAVMIAAAISGFTIPDILKHMDRDVADAPRQWQIVIDGIFQINQALSRVYSVIASIAIILWSVSILRTGGLGRGVAIYGCSIPPLVIVGIAIGHLRLDVHGMAVVVLSQTIWFFVVGFQLCFRPTVVPTHS
jgi:hypothetical protein